MTLQREELDIRTGDGMSHAWVYRSQDGKQPGVVLYPDAFGVRPSMHAMAERFATVGYAVLLPNVFYRAGSLAPFDAATAWTNPAEKDRLMALIKSLTPDRVAMDGGAYLGALAARSYVQADRLGVTGYCMGARMAFLNAGQHPEQVKAVASFHGGNLVTDDPGSPHRLAGKVKARLYFGIADEDRSCTPEHQGVLATALASAGVEYVMELYKGKKHGFAVPDHVGSFDAAADERHWRRMEAFFGEAL